MVAALQDMAGGDMSRAWGVAADVSTADGRGLLLGRVAQHAPWGGSLDCLVNNAGTNVRKPVLEVCESYS